MNGTEAKLRAIWKRVLNREVSLTDNFFDIGGNSFLALVVGEEATRSFGRDLPVGVVFHFPTVEKLAEFLDGDNAPLAHGFSLVPLVSGSGRPIFVIHWTIRDLIRHLGGDRPVYALSFGLASARSPRKLPDFEELAAHYIDEMKTVQPVGPYTLIGHSAGGVIAYEMAQQLVADGDRVEFLGLIDSSLAKEFNYRGDKLPLHRQLWNIARLPLREIYRSLRYWYIDPLRRQPRDLSEPSMTPEFWVSYAAYRPRLYSGRVTLFKATGIQSARIRRIPVERSWTKLVRDGLEICEVPGRHLSMVREPYARVLAQRMRASMEQPRKDQDERRPRAQRRELHPAHPAVVPASRRRRLPRQDSGDL